MRGKMTTIAFLCLVLAAGLTTPAGSGEGGDETSAEPAKASENDLLYTLGFAMAQQLTTLGLTEEEAAQVSAGMTDGILDREPRIPLEQVGAQVQSYLIERQQQQTEIKKQAGADFREKMSAEAGALVTDSGLICFDEVVGTGDSPQAEDTVLVNYEGTFVDGEVFDSSAEGEPATFVVGDVVPCFSEGIQRMQVGGKSKLVCSPELAYGDRGYPPVIGPGETLVFEVELVDIITPEPTPEESGTAESDEDEDEQEGGGTN